MKKTTLLLTLLVTSLALVARSYIPTADSTYIIPDDTTTVIPPVTPPSEEDAQPETPWEEADTLARKNFTPNAEVLNLRVGDTFQLQLTWDYPESEAMYSRYVTYSYNDQVISIDKDRLITARKAGETEVRLYCRGIEKGFKVIVSEGDPTSVQQRGQMILPLGEFRDNRGNDFSVTLTADTLRLQGTFWGHACIPSELSYEILDGTAYFTIHTNQEDSTCTDGYRGTFAISQTIDVRFSGCVSEAYNVYINNTLSSIYVAPEQKAYYVRTSGITIPETEPSGSPYLITEGLQWAKCYNYYPGDYRSVAYELRGDTIINGKSYKKEWSTDWEDLSHMELTGNFMREEAGKVYRKSKNSNEYLWFDYEANIGDTIFYDDCFVKVIGHSDTTIVCNGVSRTYKGVDVQVGSIFGSDTDYEYSLVPGYVDTFYEDLGLFRNGDVVSDPSFLTTGGWIELLWLKRDGTMLYQQEEGVLWRDNTSIKGINADNPDAPYYDLQGRKVANPTRGIYIKDGKKVLMK